MALSVNAKVIDKLYAYGVKLIGSTRGSSWANALYTARGSAPYQSVLCPFSNRPMAKPAVANSAIMAR